MVFDERHPNIDEAGFKVCDWAEFYRDAQEAKPLNAPAPCGNSVSMHAFVDADHARDQVTHQSHTGILIFLNMAPVVWFSKRQNTVETSTFGSEFVALKICTEMIEGLQYKLRMFGIPIDGPTNIYCDNKAVVLNTTTPESMLKKKHNAIANQRVREAIAAGTIRIAWEETTSNLADMFTKLLPANVLHDLVVKVLY